MNKCYLIGTVISEPVFDFLYLKKQISICYFNLELLDKNIIKMCAYNETADYIYRQVHKNKVVCIEGKMCSNTEKFSVQIDKIKILKDWI